MPDLLDRADYEKETQKAEGGEMKSLLIALNFLIGAIGFASIDQWWMSGLLSAACFIALDEYVRGP